MAVVFLLGILSVSGNALAADKEATALKINFKDGTSATYVLSFDAKITFENANICFTSRDWKFEIPICDLTNWTYDLPLSSVEDVISENISITQTGDVLIVAGAPAGSRINVYAVDGKRIATVKSSSEKEYISTEGWSEGVYIIKVNDRTFKIVKL